MKPDMKKFVTLFLAALLLACNPDSIIPVVDPNPVPVVPEDSDPNPETDPDPDPGYVPDETDVFALINKEKYGLDYVFDRSTLEEVHITVSQSEWDTLLAAFDSNSATTRQIHADYKFVKNGVSKTIQDGGLRLKGNVYSRRRPQSSSGSGRFQHVHYQANFRKFVKDDDHTLQGCRKIYMKWFKDDPSYVREILAYDLYKDAKVWTASFNTYCKMYIKVGDGSEKYLGIYDMIEHLDEEYLKARKELFGSSKGYLWKARYGASFAHLVDDFGADLDDGVEHRYELKTNVEDYDNAYSQIQDFIRNYTTLREEEFHTWVADHVDIPLLMRTYAVTVAVGLWDDYWCDNNNFYFYFNSTDPTDYKFYLIPYDCDNTFGIGNAGVLPAGANPAAQDPYKWGKTSNPLMTRLLRFDDYKEIYRKELLRITDPDCGIMYPDCAIKKVQALQGMIKGLVANDTGEDGSMSDSVPSWSPTNYKLISGGNNYNFFRVKANSFNDL